MNPLTIALLSAAVVVIALLWVIATAVRDVQKQLKRRRTVPSRTVNRPVFAATPPHHLQRQLIAMLGGDRDAAMRLLHGVQDKHPGHPTAWYYEKVITDLERDRRA